METTTFARGNVREIAEVEPALKAALGADYLAMSLTPKNASLHLRDGVGTDAKTQAQTVYMRTALAIDRTQPPPSRQREIAERAARATVRNADLARLHGDIASANSVTALRVEVANLARLVHQIALILDLNNSDIPEA